MDETKEHSTVLTTYWYTSFIFYQLASQVLNDKQHEALLKRTRIIKIFEFKKEQGLITATKSKK